MSYAYAAASYDQAFEPEGPDTCDLDWPEEWTCEECDAKVREVSNVGLVEWDPLEGTVRWEALHDCPATPDRRGLCTGRTYLPGHRDD